jgi:tetratricopeptide (TPR) repeat protein
LLGCEDGQTDSNRFYHGFNGYQRKISTKSPLTQNFFDQGLVMLYGFNHGGAVSSFRAAANSDPHCAMAWWGIAYANGPHINKMEISEKQADEAYRAAQEALRQTNACSAVESALIRAVAVRNRRPTPKNRSTLNVEYANAMRDVWTAFPNDPDVGVLFAESLLDLQPWEAWSRDGQPGIHTQEILSVLESVLSTCPDHPGANHLYIHAVESSPNPSRGLVCADRLVKLVPGAGHLLHMPSHIYVRVGRYADAADVNDLAIAADTAFAAESKIDPDYYSVYFVHNYHFQAYAAMMEGRYGKAINAARQLEASVAPEFAQEHADVVDGVMTTPLHVMIRFGKWEDILREPEPDQCRFLSRAERHYARAVALAALGRSAEARREMSSFDELAAQVPVNWVVGRNRPADILKVARQMALGEILFREGHVDEAFGELADGAKLEDRLAFDEPPGWMHPVRHAWGAFLMAAHRFPDAERVYRDDLERNVNNGWSLLGLETSLSAQGKKQEAIDVAAARKIAWKRADVAPAMSCYCGSPSATSP